MGNESSKEAKKPEKGGEPSRNSDPTGLAARIAEGCTPDTNYRQVDYGLVKKFKDKLSKNEVEYAKMTSQLKSFDPVVIRHSSSYSNKTS